ncbi:MAG: nitroreductase/quinone reductase family protein [Pseudomonadales bacterium]|jgi:hypothetical protein|nr:nitroreductase/quinone reductase family protein [Pseudomonadales bacterium]
MSTTLDATGLAPRAFALLNRFAEPAIRSGFGAPWPTLPLPAALWALGWHPGLVVLEVPGRRSGRLYRVPLTALVRGDTVLVSTLRRESQWVRNLAAAETVGLWLRGTRRRARPWVRGMHPDGPASAALSRGLKTLSGPLERSGLQLAELSLEAPTEMTGAGRPC